MTVGRAGAAPLQAMAIDTHAHVFLKTLTMAGGRRYAPTYDAPTATYLAHLDAHGLGGGVIVQPSFLGTDNSYLLAALAEHPERLRGVAVVPPEIGEDRLVALRRAGVAGVRLNLIGQPPPDFAAPTTKLFLERLAKTGLFAEVQVEAGRLPHIAYGILSAGVDLVVDHFGRPDAKLGVEDPGFRYLLSLGKGGRTWVKLSGAYRLAPGSRGQEIAIAAAPLLLAHFGAERLTWGSDWPHTQFETVADYGAARRSLDAWIPDVTTRRQILADTPAKLFGFTKHTLRRSA